MLEPRRCMAESRKDFELRNQNKPDCDEIQMGALQRIAAAAEKMIASYDSLREDRDRMQRSMDWYRTEYHRAQRRKAALRGVITRMRNQTGKMCR